MKRSLNGVAGGLLFVSIVAAHRIDYTCVDNDFAFLLYLIGTSIRGAVKLARIGYLGFKIKEWRLALLNKHTGK